MSMTSPKTRVVVEGGAKGDEARGWRGWGRWPRVWHRSVRPCCINSRRFIGWWSGARGVQLEKEKFVGGGD